MSENVCCFLFLQLWIKLKNIWILIIHKWRFINAVGPELGMYILTEFSPAVVHWCNKAASYAACDEFQIAVLAFQSFTSQISILIE